MSTNYYNTYQEVEDGEVSKIPAFKGKNIQVFYNGLRRISNVIENKSKNIYLPNHLILYIIIYFIKLNISQFFIFT